MNTAFSERVPGRASPLAPDDRRAMIIGAVIPLLLEHGASLTTRQIAEHLGIAEGTIFRAFGDKDSLLKAAIASFFDPAPLLDALRGIDPELSLDDTIAAIIGAVRNRLTGVFRMMAAVGGAPEQPTPREREEFSRVISEILEPHASALGWAPDRVGHAIRLVAFAAAIPETTVGWDFSTHELTELVLRGVSARPTVDPTPRNG